MKINFKTSNRIFSSWSQISVNESFDKLWFMDFMYLHWNNIIEIFFANSASSFLEWWKAIKDFYKKESRFPNKEELEKLSKWYMKTEWVDKRWKSILNAIICYFDSESPFKGWVDTSDYSFEYVQSLDDEEEEDLEQKIEEFISMPEDKKFSLLQVKMKEAVDLFNGEMIPFLEELKSKWEFEKFTSTKSSIRSEIIKMKESTAKEFSKISSPSETMVSLETMSQKELQGLLDKLDSI